MMDKNISSRYWYGLIFFLVCLKQIHFFSHRLLRLEIHSDRRTDKLVKCDVELRKRKKNLEFVAGFWIRLQVNKIQSIQYDCCTAILKSNRLRSFPRYEHDLQAFEDMANGFVVIHDEPVKRWAHPCGWCFTHCYSFKHRFYSMLGSL